MPFTRQNAHLGNNQENQTRFGGKAEKFRAALTNISNKAPSNARGLGKKAKQEISKPHPNKSKVTSRLKDTEKENAHVLQVQQKETSPDVHMQVIVFVCFFSDFLPASQQAHIAHQTANIS